ncbi:MULTISPECIES: HAD-IIA family hydrolase [unclassified Rathayibacter]|uniref:HAD-IIA family hydrolase n=1 Tax=unclassified Rathayibacter TaxID=2609250 RepID=UPI00188C3C7C|nr:MULTISPECIES: HAD hydrolase-like protein [unclassified Rathayibacter]MBF4461804.1 HAD hydrolase-like protein [Rathayibacter sp. VKM Ac-2879]MBF4503217.1 HAD hydrolase-like protein [Rathayibacter sp. VKM Ac-2878]
MPDRETLVLCDLDGTLYQREELVPGADRAVASLRSLATLRFMTNTDSTPTDTIARRLEGLGLGPMDVADVFTPVAAASRRLAGLGRAVLMVNQGVASELGAVVHPVSSRGEPADAVVVGDVAGLLDYELLDRAFDAIRRGAQLLALQRGRYFRAADGDHIDTGAVVAALEYATGATAQVLGKPSVDFVELAIASAGGRDRFRRIVVVGDDRSSDIRMAVDAALESVQVRTGKASDQVGDPSLPVADHVIDSISDLVQLVGGRP